MEEKEDLSGYSPSEGDPRPEATPVDDQALMRLAQRGDQRAVTVLYTRYRRRILNYLYRFTGERASAEDLTQETFVRVVQHLSSYRPTGSLAGWIYRIAGNLALNSLRQKKRLKEFSLDEPLQLEEDSVDRKETIASRGLQPDEEAVQSEKEVLIQAALLKVSARYREALILCDMEGYQYHEAAEMLKCSINTVASRLARGRVQLAELLGYLNNKKEGNERGERFS